MVRYGNDHLLASFGPNAGVYYVEALRAVRESKDIVLSFADMPGLAAFPSFHTIVGLLIVYACRGNIATLLLASLWTAAMLLATPVYGGHYFIDIIAGAVVTVLLAAAYTTVKVKNLASLPSLATTNARL
jgi:membrane-associated phospholipid phosphatase